ncbi:EAL domain-containing protein [Chitinolyticbacter meiyuanensis]|uniref:EAL domain-containing protein n=1 Tax=Chitinolyticbacter meiyuanensis TaxID=682798 RepID=UPI0011E5BD66|nr:EAL domain-containing protein [Chitinolyticbacter meiyuanensis]
MLSGVDILIAEDSVSQAVLLQRLLETQGCTVRLARNGLEALERVAERAPTLIVSDVIMPKMGGYELCRAIKSAPDSRHVPVILITEMADARDVVQGLACGADNFILKPYDEKYLISRIRAFLANQANRQPERPGSLGVDIVLGGERHFITAGRQQILELLMSTYEQRGMLASQLKSKHAELFQSHAVVDALYHFSARLSEQPDEAGVIAQALQAAAAFPLFRAAWLWLYRPETNDLIPAGCSGDADASALPTSTSLSCACQLGQSLLNAHNVSDCRAPHAGGNANHACIPLRSGEQLLGMLNVARADGAAWSEDELASFNVAGQQLSIALARVRFFGQLESQVEERTAALRSEMAERSRAELAWRQGEALMAKVLDTLPLGVWVTDNEGRVIRQTPEALRIWDRPLLPELMPDGSADEIEPVARAVKRALKLGDSVLGEVVSVHSGGSERTLLVSAVPLANDRSQIQGAIVMAQDITAQQVVDRELRIRNKAIDAGASGILVTDLLHPEQPIVYVNQAFERITGYSKEAVLGRNCRFLQGRDRDQPDLVFIRRAVAQGTEGKALLRNYRKDGSMFWNALHVLPAPDAQGRITHYVGVIDDVTASKLDGAQAAHHACYDVRTGLPNRNLLLDRLSQAALQSNRRQESFALAVVLFDDYGGLAERLGTVALEQMVGEQVERLRGLLHEFDTLARVADDEFALLLPDARDEPRLQLLLEQIDIALAEAVNVPGHGQLKPGYRIGYCFYPADGQHAEELLRHAALAATGPDHVQRRARFEPAMDESIARRSTLRQSLHEALLAGQLQVYYQPQLDLRRATLCGMEALVRWRPHGLPLPAAEAVRLAEEGGFVAELDFHVLDIALAQAAAWLADDVEVPRIAVNLSTLTIQQPDLIDRVCAALARHQVPPHTLTLEASETLLVQHHDLARSVMPALRQHGVQWAIDDFGTGQAALSDLRQFPIDQLKIDKRFVDDVYRDVDNAAMTRAIIGLAASLGIEVIAEGVETVEQLSFLLQSGCEQIQGYCYSPPLPAESCSQLLARSGSLHLPDVALELDPRILLVVDAEPRIHSHVYTDLNAEGYHFLNVDSAEAALDMLAINDVAVVLVDPKVTLQNDGAILGEIRQRYPDVVRVAMSAYIDVEQTQRALNEGAVFRYVPKPWDKTQLVQQMREAFHQHELNVLFKRRSSS